LDDIQYDGSEPRYHYPQALNLQGGASGSLEEAQAGGGEEVGSKERGRKSPGGWVRTIHHLVGK